MKRSDIYLAMVLVITMLGSLSACGDVPEGDVEPPPGVELQDTPAAREVEQPLTDAETFTHPAVFNWQFYLQSNGDLLQLGLRTEDDARNHWLNTGLADGRQAHPGFHTKQYLDDHEDVSRSCGRDRYRCAISHYISNGIREKRKGYREGGYDGRYTVSNDQLIVSASRRVAGAIDSIVYRNRELLNSFDHGRQMQIAFTKNGLGECYNPNEGGQERDQLGNSSASNLSSIVASGASIRSRVTPAYWLRPGQESIPQRCGGARNRSIVSNYTFEKEVTIGWGGDDNVIEFVSRVTIPANEDVVSYAFEGPTGYLTDAFVDYYTLASDGRLTRVGHDPMGEQYEPLVFSTTDGSAAMGAFSPDFASGSYDGPRYGKFAFLDPRASIEKTNKWNIVFRRGATPAGTYTFRSFIVVGSRDDVARKMSALMRQFTPPIVGGDSLVTGRQSPEERTPPAIGADYSLPGIRDYDGHLHGGAPASVDGAYRFQGYVDVQGDGRREAVYTNLRSGRWVTARLQPDSAEPAYAEHGENGATRVVGTYVDPLVAEGEANGGRLLNGESAPVRGGPHDSQRRFRSDLARDNLELRAARDFDGDGAQELYWKLRDGTAYLRTIMHSDGNIRYANYQDFGEIRIYLQRTGFGSLVEFIR